MKNFHSKPPTPSCCFNLDFNGVFGIFLRVLGFQFGRMRSLRCLTFIYLIRTPKRPLLNRLWINLEVGWIYQFTPNLAAAWTGRQVARCLPLTVRHHHDDLSLATVGGYSSLENLSSSPMAKYPTTKPFDGSWTVLWAVNCSFVWGLPGIGQKFWVLPQGPLDGPWG